MRPYTSISLTAHHNTESLKTGQKVALAFVGFGLLIFMVYWLEPLVR